jgi:hypothetical protein
MDNQIVKGSRCGRLSRNARGDPQPSPNDPMEATLLEEFNLQIQCADGASETFRFERFAQKRSGAHLVGFSYFPLSIEGGDYDNRNRGVRRFLLQPFQYLKSVHLLHSQIKQDQPRIGKGASVRVSAFAFQVTNKLLAALDGLDRGLWMKAQHSPFDKSDIIRVIVNNEN